MTASAATAHPDPRAPWLCDDHWSAGDQALWIQGTASAGLRKTLVDIVSPAEGTVRDPNVTYNNGVFQVSGRFENIRHRSKSCVACATSVHDLFLGSEGAL
ncbi:hypothetical protein R3Q06_29845 [Rhodococcus erythropolis]|uniref:hypothetical protein n=1 Tax=Rhodococcus erythropolis TaxID=1833 RepID=UPI002949044A|nr:hypothetical protein [Rhodococcus erythropolis]MDV6277700.1 hypothetical protein [Rhodococcus erythropolis]